MQAEINVELRKFEDTIIRGEVTPGAISLYVKLLAATPLGSPRHKFVAIRSAFAHLALGDQMFRKQRVLSDHTRQTITDRYDNAVRLLQEKEVSPDNPRRQQVEAHASQQQAKLQRRLNYLGLWDGFVPVQRYSRLQEDADVQIGDAKTSAEAFSAFLESAETRGEEQKDVEFQIKQEELSLAILDKRQENATLGVDKIEEQLRAINDQGSFLSLGLESLPGASRAIVEGLGVGTATPARPKLGFATGAVGVGGAVVNFLAQREQLAHQRATAEIEQEIAENDVQIAKLEIEISTRRREFYEQKLAFLENRRLNADFLYLLAELNERRAERQLEVAIFLAYLFERALAFFLGEPHISHIQFDYLDRPGKIEDAAKALREDFRFVQQERDKVTQQKFDFFEEIISLRESYPIQFSRFLQTGEMDFVYSLYQLSKRRPASHQCRLREVGVEVVGLLPATGFSGTLIMAVSWCAIRQRPCSIRTPRDWFPPMSSLPRRWRSSAGKACRWRQSVGCCITTWSPTPSS